MEQNATANVPLNKATKTTKRLNAINKPTEENTKKDV